MLFLSSNKIRSMKIISYNVNGIRAAIRKGFIEWLENTKADVVCLQEIKATPEQFDQEPFEDLGYNTIPGFRLSRKAIVV